MGFDWASPWGPVRDLTGPAHTGPVQDLTGLYWKPGTPFTDVTKETEEVCVLTMTEAFSQVVVVHD